MVKYLLYQDGFDASLNGVSVCTLCAHMNYMRTCTCRDNGYLIFYYFFVDRHSIFFGHMTVMH